MTTSFSKWNEIVKQNYEEHVTALSSFWKSTLDASLKAIRVCSPDSLIGHNFGSLHTLFGLIRSSNHFSIKFSSRIISPPN